MKITAGSLKNRKITTPKGEKTRPTPSKVREAIFNICQSKTIDARFLDLFSGTGIMSFEALSRGAVSSLLIDNSREAKRCILQNIEALTLQGQAAFQFGDVLKLLEKVAVKREFDIIYADPPYGKGIGEKLLRLIDGSPLLAPGGLLFIEEGDEIVSENLKTLTLVDVRTYGKSKLHRFERIA
jgi:16S rRNA (guanine966-N2)-methyltransferase